MDALVLIDLQEDFFDAGPLAERRAAIVQVVNTVARDVAAAGGAVIEVRTQHRRDKSTWALNMLEDDQPVVLEGTDGVRRLPELDLPDGTVELVKTRDDAFLGTDLEHLLRELAPQHVFLAGVSTEACIALTAASAYARNFEVVLIDDAIASADADAHERFVDWLQDQYRQHSVPSGEVAAMLRSTSSR